MTTRSNTDVEYDSRSVLEAIPETVQAAARVAADMDEPSALLVAHIRTRGSAFAFLASLPDDEVEQAERGIREAARGEEPVVAKIVPAAALAALFESKGEWVAAESVLAEPEPGSVVVVAMSQPAWWIGTVEVPDAL